MFTGHRGAVAELLAGEAHHQRRRAEQPWTQELGRPAQARSLGTQAASHLTQQHDGAKRQQNDGCQAAEV